MRAHMRGAVCLKGRRTLRNDWEILGLEHPQLKKYWRDPPGQTVTAAPASVGPLASAGSAPGGNSAEANRHAAMPLASRHVNLVRWTAHWDGNDG